jgi:hypothetical protein
MPRYRSLGAAIVASLPVLAISGPAGHAAFLHPAVRAKPSVSSWRLDVTKHFGPAGFASGYSEIVTTGGHVWVFGGTNPGGQSVPVAETLVRGRWRPARLPSGLTDFISAASAPAPNDIWAISDYGRYVLRWDGRSWRLIKTWKQAGPLSDVVALSPRNVWIFGTSAAGAGNIGTWHFNGRTWTAVGGAAGNIYRASAVSAWDIWAIVAGGRTDEVMHYGAHGWRVEKMRRSLAAIRWHDILAESRTDVWMIGNATTKTGIGKLVLAHWNGVRWSAVTTPVRAWAGQLAAAGRGRLLATGTTGWLVPTGVILQLGAAGHLTWMSISSTYGSGVTDVAYAPGSHSLWASGGILTRLGGDAAVWVLSLPSAPAARTDADRL